MFEAFIGDFGAIEIQPLQGGPFEVSQASVRDSGFPQVKGFELAQGTELFHPFIPNQTGS